ncbi:MAG: response regulator [Belnapia sp.]|nr:response regulator [Belnapia sp.]
MLKVLIVEDDFMVADCLEEILSVAGFNVCAITGNVADAITLGEQHAPDLAVIDLHLNDGGFGTEVGAALCERINVGVLYASGNPDDPRLRDARGAACIAKPYSASSIVAALHAVSDRTIGRAAWSELPKGLRLLIA